ncbi:MAG: LptA/OstA family protein [Thiotrichaceae bacterium]
MYLRNSLLWIMVLSLPYSAFALSTDHNQPINIQSDTAMIDDNNGLAIYTGNVVVTQSTIRIDAEKSHH